MTGYIGHFGDAPGGPKGCRRATGRVQQHELLCNLGPVIDFSRGGMRVAAERRLRGEHEVMLPTEEGHLTVKARVVWTRRCGIRRFVVGMEFLDVDAETAGELAHIASLHAREYPLAG